MRKAMVDKYQLIIILFSFLITGLSGNGNLALVKMLKLESEFDNNILRSSNVGVHGDFKTNFYFDGGKTITYKNTDNLNLGYTYKYNNYYRYKKYNRHDHLLSLGYNKSILNSIAVDFNNEFKVRRYKDNSQWEYNRNVFDINVRLKIFKVESTSIGYQNWSKNYPNNKELFQYQSNRLYLKTTRNVNISTNFTLKYEYQLHKGNLYPESIISGEQIGLTGSRNVLQLSANTVSHNNLLINVTVRYEDDISDSDKLNQSGNNETDEDPSDLLEEDSDFNYRKAQLKFSLVYKITRKLSLMSFDLIQYKHFREWQVLNSRGVRKDLTLYVTNALQYKIDKNWRIDLKFIIESNNTEVKFYDYNTNSIVLGISFSR